MHPPCSGEEVTPCTHLKEHFVVERVHPLSDVAAPPTPRASPQAASPGNVATTPPSTSGRLRDQAYNDSQDYERTLVGVHERPLSRLGRIDSDTPHPHLGVCKTGAYPAPSLSGEDQKIRLITILSGQGDDPIRCLLVNVHLKEVGNYEALSYTWGSPEFSRAISINNTDFNVGENLFQALSHLRSVGSDRALWVDAICINQSDISERNRQVQQMPDIYLRAHRVIVWLGLETESSRAAFDFLRSTYAFSPLNRKETMEDPGWHALGQLCQREYWRRVWIVQEICLAQRLVVVCGASQIPWEYISGLRAARKHIWPQYLSKGEREFMRSLPARIDQQREAKKGGCILWGLLENFQESECADYHDKVYGFLGLSDDCGRGGIRVDYSRSVDQLYEDVMWFYHGHFQSRNDFPSRRSPQLMRLSEFLQGLLGCHPSWRAESSPALRNVELRGSHNQVLRPPTDQYTRSRLIDISATNLLVIRSFLTREEARQHRALELVDFLQGGTPYSHLGTWRDLISPNTNVVQAINPSGGYAISSVVIPPTGLNLSQKAERPSAFVSVPVNHQGSKGDDAGGHVIGVAPPGSQTGDVVCTFLDTRIALILRPVRRGNAASIIPIAHGGLDGERLVLVGRAILDLDPGEAETSYRSRLKMDKTVETVQVDTGDINPKDVPWPATVLIDMLTLRCMSKPDRIHAAQAYKHAPLDLMPPRTSIREGERGSNARLHDTPETRLLFSYRKDPERFQLPLGDASGIVRNPSTIQFAMQPGLAKQGQPNASSLPLETTVINQYEEEMDVLRKEKRLRKQAIASGHTGIINPGRIGYAIVRLQILYMLKPLREVLPSVHRCF